MTSRPPLPAAVSLSSALAELETMCADRPAQVRVRLLNGAIVRGLAVDASPAALTVTLSDGSGSKTVTVAEAVDIRVARPQRVGAVTAGFSAAVVSAVLVVSNRAHLAPSTIGLGVVALIAVGWFVTTQTRLSEWLTSWTPLFRSVPPE